MTAWEPARCDQRPNLFRKELAAFHRTRDLSLDGDRLLMASETRKNAPENRLYQLITAV